ncbi:hypothetical protein ZWY2020_016195 [Hordeum vulgare]|nr:hypothetical protein ZWY2020_016195 [Hordeum vulgare]
MSLTSSSSSAVRHRVFALPLIRCTCCKDKVRMFVSTIEKHDGWVFYECQNHGVSCELWRWELEYVQYLVDNHYLVGDAVVDAIGAAEECREQLLNAQELHYMNGSTNNHQKFVKREREWQCHDQAASCCTDEAWERAGDAHEGPACCCADVRCWCIGGVHGEELKISCNGDARFILGD